MWYECVIASEISELIEENTSAILQLAQFVSELSPEHYQYRLGVQRQHAVGKHVRHIVDHYEAFLQAADELTYEAPRKLNYEQRMRDVHLEREPDLASRRLLEIARSLPRLKNGLPNRAILFDHPTETSIIEMNSSVGRELVFLSSHTIHHMAIIGLLAEQLGIRHDATFGVHPSTLRHWQNDNHRGPDDITLSSIQ